MNKLKIKLKEEERNFLNEFLKKGTKKAREERRNKEGKKINWRFTKEDADRKLSKYYVI